MRRRLYRLLVWPSFNGLSRFHLFKERDRCPRCGNGRLKPFAPPDDCDYVLLCDECGFWGDILFGPEPERTDK